MLETHLKSPITQQRLRSGLAADHIDGFADWLHFHGYGPVTIDTALRSLAGWADWMREAGFTAQGLLAGFEACKAELKRGHRVRYCRGPNGKSLASAALFIRFLREQGVLPRPAASPSSTDLWPVLGDFRSWRGQSVGCSPNNVKVERTVNLAVRYTVRQSVCPSTRSLSDILDVTAQRSFGGPAPLPKRSGPVHIYRVRKCSPLALSS